MLGVTSQLMSNVGIIFVGVVGNKVWPTLYCSGTVTDKYRLAGESFYSISGVHSIQNTAG
jgi:hypothetical protein